MVDKTQECITIKSSTIDATSMSKATKKAAAPPGLDIRNFFGGSSQPKAGSSQPRPAASVRLIHKSASITD
jgi:hypothetical protein